MSPRATYSKNLYEILPSRLLQRLSFVHQATGRLLTGLRILLRQCQPHPLESSGFPLSDKFKHKLQKKTIYFVDSYIFRSLSAVHLRANLHSSSQATGTQTDPYCRLPLEIVPLEFSRVLPLSCSRTDCDSQICLRLGAIIVTNLF
ncbi:uncharacterized protein LOC121404895 [Drosophila obscura]|uniref:uncharacterized protein LOC121404895 n=1 Tax=Drosophila obscura TaxID=7282 RepID=UPI001BB13881|nr:uncharacterized protein LOC121404895 [Drosophila obscura]